MRECVIWSLSRFTQQTVSDGRQMVLPTACQVQQWLKEEGSPTSTSTTLHNLAHPVAYWLVVVRTRRYVSCNSISQISAHPVNRLHNGSRAAEVRKSCFNQCWLLEWPAWQPTLRISGGRLTRRTAHCFTGTPPQWIWCFRWTTGRKGLLRWAGEESPHRSNANRWINPPFWPSVKTKY